MKQSSKPKPRPEAGFPSNKQLSGEIGLLLVLLIILVLLLAAKTAAPAAGAGTVGGGTPASCTEAALDAALAGGGSVSFNCGGSPHHPPHQRENDQQ